MNRLQSLIRPTRTSAGDWPEISIENLLTWQNQLYQFGINQTITGNKEEPIPGDFMGLVRGVYKRNGVAASCMFIRQRLLSEARFQFQRLESGREGALFGTTDLAILEKPWPGGTTGDLIARSTAHVDLAGNAYIYRKFGSDRLKVLRPDWTTIVLGNREKSAEEFVVGDIDNELVGYIYEPGGRSSRAEPVTLRPDEVAHWAPIPDPEAEYRGMSWLTPVIRELQADGAAQTHKQMFFEHGGTPNMVVMFNNPMKREDFDDQVKKFRANHEGAWNAYKTLFLGSGASVEVVGADLKQLDFAVSQGMGEVRICADAGVPAILAGIKAGLDASTYSNFGQARRQMADGTLRPLWRNLAGSLEVIVPTPAAARLWYDDRGVAFVREDVKDAAEARQKDAATISTLVMAGYEPDSVVAAVVANDLTQLEHTGLPSVQLQPARSTNGSGPDAVALHAGEE